jgi:uncharacterized protein with WD repeat
MPSADPSVFSHEDTSKTVSQVRKRTMGIESQTEKQTSRADASEKMIKLARDHLLGELQKSKDETIEHSLMSGERVISDLPLSAHLNSDGLKFNEDSEDSQEVEEQQREAYEKQHQHVLDAARLFNEHFELTRAKINQA